MRFFPSQGPGPELESAATLIAPLLGSQDVKIGVAKETEISVHPKR